MSKLPINDEVLSPMEEIIERVRMCYKVLTSKKVIVTTINVNHSNNRTAFLTDTLSVTKEEMAVTSRITMMRLSEDQDLNCKMYQKLNTAAGL